MLFKSYMGYADRVRSIEVQSSISLFLTNLKERVWERFQQTAGGRNILKLN